MTDWKSLLDAMDAGLNSFPPVVLEAATLPVASDPVPAALVARADQTLHRMAEATTTLEHHRAEIGRELTALSAANATIAARPPDRPPLPRHQGLIPARHTPGPGWPPQGIVCGETRHPDGLIPKRFLRRFGGDPSGTAGSAGGRLRDQA